MGPLLLAPSLVPPSVFSVLPLSVLHSSSCGCCGCCCEPAPCCASSAVIWMMQHNKYHARSAIIWLQTCKLSTSSAFFCYQHDNDLGLLTRDVCQPCRCSSPGHEITQLLACTMQTSEGRSAYPPHRRSAALSAGPRRCC